VSLQGALRFRFKAQIPKLLQCVASDQAHHKRQPGPEIREHYDVIDAHGQAVGAVVHEADTSLTPPFITHHSLVQRAHDGKVIVEARW
jgi:hypothetical protein